MPTRVHAIVVTRHGATSHAQLLRTLEALSAQTRPLDAVTLVVCGDAHSIRQSERVAASVEGIIQTRPGDSFAHAVALGLRRVDAEAAVWLLDHDSTPAPDALAELTAALERAPMAAIAAPKLITDHSPPEIASLGVSMTPLGRTVEAAAGEIDQGQRDGEEDALGADVRGMLLRAGSREALVPDPGLGPADLGLDLGVRARLAGWRIVLTPLAHVTVTGGGPAAVPARLSAHTYSVRRAQLHRRLVYAPGFAVLLHWLSLLPLALWRSLAHLVGKRPAAVIPEWAAALTVAVRIPAIVRARSRLRRHREAGWGSVEPFRVSASELRRRLDDGHGSERGAVSELRFFSGGGAWAVLAALIVGVASFVSLLAWPALGGGGLLPLRTTVSALWRDAAWGGRGLGVDVVGPADPFAGVVALLGSLWPAAPSYALVLLWLLALPFAVLGGWFASTRVTDRAGLRILGGVLWALAPTFLTALVHGRPAAVLAHLLLPWLFHAASVAHRSWGAAGAASLLLAAVLACAPSLAPAALVLWALAVIFALVHRLGHGAARLAWVPVPAAVVFAPLIWWQIQRGNAWALLADPGRIWDGPQAPADAAGRALLVTGFPSPERAGWDDLLGEHAVWAALLLAPLAVLALAAAMAPRWRAGIALLIVTAAGLATALFSIDVVVAFAQGVPVAIWPGTALSLAWIGLVGAALVTLDTALPRWHLRSAAALVVGLAVVACAVPALTALARDATHLTNGPVSTLPAYVAADARGELPRATLILTPLDERALSARTVWGASETLGAQTTLVTTATAPVGTDVSELALALVSPRVFDAAADLSALGIRYVLIAAADDETASAREARLAAVSALGQRADFVKVGETDKGTLWRTDAETRAPVLSTGEARAAQQVLALTFAALLAALLLSLPTRASRRAARARSRIVGEAEEDA